MTIADTEIIKDEHGNDAAIVTYSNTSGPLTTRPAVRGLRAVYGVHDVKPIVNLPFGDTRLRMRNNEFAKLFVRTDSGIRQFFLEDLGGSWKAHEQGRNERRKETLVFGQPEQS